MQLLEIPILFGEGNDLEPIIFELPTIEAGTEELDTITFHNTTPYDFINMKVDIIDSSGFVVLVSFPNKIPKKSSDIMILKTTVPQKGLKPIAITGSYSGTFVVK